MEALRYVPYLSKTGSLVTNETPFVNISNYPDLENTYETLSKQINIIRIDADQIAKEAGNAKASNMVMLGAASPFIAIHEEIIIKGIKSIFHSKGEEIVEMNIRAFKAGRAFSLSHQKN
jgi:indolepyruvate ferredoxin oxidoreductase beta subunit